MTLIESITGSDYEALAEFRYQIRKFLHFSERAAREAGIEPQQHQLLLAIRGFTGPAEPPSIGILAERLQIQHHSAVELVDRLVERGLVARSRGPSDRRQVLVHLTPRGESELGLALVFVDMRGTGVSQGHVSGVFSREERADIGAIVEWIAAQPWSDGRVVATGVSYDANLAALALVNGGKAMAASVPQFIDFDTYRDLAVPGGVRNEMLLREWGALPKR